MLNKYNVLVRGYLVLVILLLPGVSFIEFCTIHLSSPRFGEMYFIYLTSYQVYLRLH